MMKDKENTGKIKPKGQILPRNYFKDPFFRGLSRDHKILWFCIVNETSFSGFWNRDFDYLTYLTKIEAKPEELVEVFKGKFEDIGDYWFIPSTIEWSDSKGLNVKHQIHPSIYRDMIRVGIDCRKYEYLFQSSEETSIEAFEKLYGTARTRLERGSAPRLVVVEDEVAVEVDVENVDVVEVEVGKKKLCSWIVTNYPREDRYSEEEKEELQTLVDTWEGLVGMDKVKEMILWKRDTDGPNTVYPLIEFLQNHLKEEQKRAKKLA